MLSKRLLPVLGLLSLSAVAVGQNNPHMPVVPRRIVSYAWACGPPIGIKVELRPSTDSKWVIRDFGRSVTACLLSSTKKNSKDSPFERGSRC